MHEGRSADKPLVILSEPGNAIGLNSLATGGTECHRVELLRPLSGSFTADRTIGVHGLFPGCLAVTGRDKVLPTRGSAVGVAGPQSPDPQRSDR